MRFGRTLTMAAMLALTTGIAFAASHGGDNLLLQAWTTELIVQPWQAHRRWSRWHRRQRNRTLLLRHRQGRSQG